MRRRIRGLSPRVRGNRVVGISALDTAGSIPACAGEPMGSNLPHHSQKVYPRVCGGTVNQAVCGDRLQGLSPRVRGNPDHGDDGASALRSIPACAGEPRLSIPSSPCLQVYPRVCGGTRSCRAFPARCGGLSPRVRGNRSKPPVCRPRRRSIPACAGEPGPVLAARDAPGVYPRVCGGTHCVLPKP